ncbi:hypothetical protein E4K73_50795, partial [Streptomyces sp. IB201691-2A2]
MCRSRDRGLSGIEGKIILINLALRQAMLSKCRYRVGAVLALGTRVMAFSPNRQRNNPAIDHLHATFHAEEYVLRRTARSRGATIYVARVDSSGHPALARPCPRCEQALLNAGVRRAYYTIGKNSLDSVKPLIPLEVLRLDT